jgi:cell division transport system permease protein
MSACIFLFGVFYSIGTNFESLVRSAEEGVSVTVFFDEGITQEQIDAIGDEISKRPEVAHYQFVSAEEAWEYYKSEYFEGREDAAESFAGDNPLANSANYEIYMNDISMQQALVTYLEGLDGVREVHQSEVAAQTLSDFNKLIGYISTGVILILIAVAVFLINNTVTVGISVRKEEIAIMKLIGAKDNFVRAPFIVEGITIGLIGSVIPLVLLFFLYQSIIAYVADRFQFIGSIISFVPVQEVFTILVPVSLLLGVGIGYVGSRLTLKKHLKV